MMDDNEKYLSERESYEFQFIVGRSYRRKDGKIVKIISEFMKHGKNYRCVQGDDGGEYFDLHPGAYKSRAEAGREAGYRYDRSGDVGRCTGGPTDNPRNLIPGAVDIRVGDKLYVAECPTYRNNSTTTYSWKEVTRVGRLYFYIGEGWNELKFDRATMREVEDQNRNYQAYCTEQESKDADEHASLLASVKDEFKGYATTHTLSLEDLRAIAKLLKIGETK